MTAPLLAQVYIVQVRTEQHKECAVAFGEVGARSTDQMQSHRAARPVARQAQTHSVFETAQPEMVEVYRRFVELPVGERVAGLRDAAQIAGTVGITAHRFPVVQPESLLRRIPL